jgi:hypothetical protein
MIKAVNQRFNVQISRADAVNRRYDAPKNMIQAIVLGGIFDSHYIPRIFNNAQEAPVPFVTLADDTNPGI